MPITKTTSKPAAKRARSAPRKPDAIALLKDDHARVGALFEQYEKSRSATRKQAIVATICRELTLHAMVEEEIFYPAVQAALKDRERVPEAIVEHATLKEFIAKVDGKLPDGDMFDAQVRVMGEYVKHHVKEEHADMFPKARKTRLDMADLGQRILDRKAELVASGEPLPQVPDAVAELPSRVPA